MPDDLPELATNAEWRGIMKRARVEHGLTQEELGKKIGTSQVMVSAIESGRAGSSKFVLPICAALSIPEPTHFANEDDRDWVQLGRLLRFKNPEQFRRAMKLVESMVGDEEAAQPGTPETDSPKPTRPK